MGFTENEVGMGFDKNGVGRRGLSGDLVWRDGGQGVYRRWGHE